MNLDEAKREDMQRLLSQPIFFPPEYKTWLADYSAMNIPLIPFSHIFGSHINIARSGDYIETSESTTSASYTDLTTVGPQIANLADGSYLVGFGVRSRGYASLSYNGSTPDDNYGVNSQEAGNANARMRIVSLSNNNSNSIKVQYKNGTFSHRWLFVIRIGAVNASLAP